MSCFTNFHKVTHGGVVGIALQRRALLFTVFEIDKNGDPTIFKVTDKGQESVFAPTFPSTQGTQECQLEVNPGLGPWEDFCGYVYVTQGSKIFEITPDGLHVDLFATTSSNVDFRGTGITFDRVGTFCYDMILGDMKGNVFRVDPSMRGKTLKPFANVQNAVLGDTLAVVPKCLGPHGGEIWVSAEEQGKVYSVSATVPPVISTIVDTIIQPGNISVIPFSPKELGRSGGAYFAADWPGEILECPKSAFRGLGGNVLVGQESGGGISIIKFDRVSKKYVASKFGNPFQGNAEGAAFVHRHHHHHDSDDDLQDDDDDNLDDDDDEY